MEDGEDLPAEHQPEEREVRAEGYQVDSPDGRKFVIFDPQNPLAWVLSTRWGTPPDARADDADDAADTREEDSQDDRE